VIRFQTSTNRTGTHRIIKVELHDTVAEIAAWYAATYPGAHDPRHPATAAFTPRADWADRDPRAWQGTIHLARDAVDMVVVMHEATHAAAHLYSIDLYRDHARASAHLHAFNEPLAYMVGDIAGRIGRRLIDLGVELNVGNPEHHGTAEHPPH